MHQKVLEASKRLRQVAIKELGIADESATKVEVRADRTAGDRKSHRCIGITVTLSTSGAGAN